MKQLPIKNIDFLEINNLANNFINTNQNYNLYLKDNLFSKPSGIAYLSTLIQQNKDNLNIDIENQNSEKIRYLQRTNFFTNLDILLDENFNRYNVANNMLECSKVQTSDDPDLVDKNLKKILETHLADKEQLILGILLTTYEITDNILEHSEGKKFQQGLRSIEKSGFVSAQYYGNSYNHIEIGISDSGIGIINTMQEAYPDLSRREVLKKAFESNTTRFVKTMPNRGNGLAKLKEVVLESNGEVICRTSEYRIHINNKNKDGIIYKEDNRIKGTHFKIIIGCSKTLDTKKIFNTEPEDYVDSLDDFFID